MRALDKKLLRDLAHIWGQALAIALVLSAGVATLILAVGAYQSLEETRLAYYERYRFADVFADVTRAPKELGRRIATIEGVASVETRVRRLSVLDVEGFAPPVTGLVQSVPDARPPSLNLPHVRAGRLPAAGSTTEAAVNEAFAASHHLSIGDSFGAILNGKKQRLTIVGILLSPEHIYAIGPGDLVPDDRRFAVVWMAETGLEDILDLDGAFNSVSLKLLRHASKEQVIERLDALLGPFGGEGAYGRADQLSHAFLDAELKQLRALARIIPPIFFFVSVFLINTTLSRIIALEREQIGLLKALGYGRTSVAAHYVKLVLVIAAVGILIGFLFGTRFGLALTRLYSEFFHFPFLVFESDPALYLLAAGLSLLAAVAGAARAVANVLALPPAVAMQPPAPPRYNHLWTERLGLYRHLGQLTLMSLRHITHWPARAFFTMLGISLSGSLLVVSLFTFDSIEHMIDVSYFQIQRQDATLMLAEQHAERVLLAIERLPGVMRAESVRSVSARLRNGQYTKRVAIHGKPLDPALARVIDKRLRRVILPDAGLVVDARIAELLRLRRGEIVDIEILGGWRPPERSNVPLLEDAGQVGPGSHIRVPVSAVIESYFGLSAFMNQPELNRLLGEGPTVTSVLVQYDPSDEEAFFAAVKATPDIAGVGLRAVSLAKFRETLSRNIDMMVSVYAGLAIIVAVGVAYNSARIQLSEQARELASLRVLGFTKAEVSRVLLLELAVLVVAAQPLAWFLGYWFGWLTIQGFSSDLYRVPLIIETSTYAWSSVVVIAASTASALIVRRRIGRLDLIEVLKTRE